MITYTLYEILKWYIYLIALPKIDLAGIPQKMINVHAGKPIVLNIPITGRPAPTCSWFFGGVKMKDTLDRIKIETTAKYTKLTVRETTLDDTGDYTLEVKNITGVTTEIIKVVILGENNVLSHPRFCPSLRIYRVSCTTETDLTYPICR